MAISTHMMIQIKLPVPILMVVVYDQLCKLIKVSPTQSQIRDSNGIINARITQLTVKSFLLASIFTIMIACLRLETSKFIKCLIR
jgi:hypothetical protein